MRPILIAHFLIFMTGFSFAQQAAALPGRYCDLGKDARFRLLRILGTPELHPTYTSTSAFSADRRVAVYVEDLSTGADDKPMFRSRIIVGAPGGKVWPREIDVPGKTVTALCISADGTRALLAGETVPEKEKNPDTYLSLWDLNAGKEIKSFITHERQIMSVALSRDAATALTGTSENLKRWDLKTGKELLLYGEKDKSSVTALAYLPEGKCFLAGFRGGEVRLYEVERNKHVRAFKAKGELSFVWHLAPSQDGKRFVSADYQPTVSLWETETGKELGTLRVDKKGAEEAVTGIALGDDKKTVLIAWQKVAPDADEFASARLSAWNGETGKTEWSHTASYRGRLPMLAQDGKLLVGGGPNLFEVWSIKEGKRLQSLGGHKSPVNSVAAWPDGEILSGGQEGALLRWRDGELLGKIDAHTGAVIAMTMSKDRKQLLTIGGDRTAKLWHPGQTKAAQTLKGHAGPITSAAFSTSGRWAATGSGDRSARIWDLMTGKEIASFAGHSEGVNAVAISPDDQWLATASDDATIKLWPLKDGKLDADRDTIALEKHKKAVMCIAFTADGKRLVSGSQDQTVMVWDCQKGSMDFMITGHKNWITSVLAHDANTILTTSDDLNVCAWDLATGNEIGRIDFGKVGDCPRCLATLGNRVLVGSSSWMIYEFEMVKSKGSKGSSK
jgi:WD40 repeat protein